MAANDYKKSWNLQFCFISSLLYFWYLALQHSASPLVSAQKGLRLMTKAITDLTLSLSLSLTEMNGLLHPLTPTIATTVLIKLKTTWVYEFQCEATSEGF